ncbi:pre T-cell antigen receptor alpha [Tachyglossus aculeatus]|uniref:pre T-cell antigen receptor alpha n=1 Tax=Tachyglossus aculeatus TaxID=9261 RepID=UPI0018F5EF46|nr:pre T-cell antigen receptor alpha [Tachyglossus aculeatus]
MSLPWLLPLLLVWGSPALPLLPGVSAVPFPTLAPPLTMLVNGQRQTLVVCLVSDVSPDAALPVWFSTANGSALDSFSYGSIRAPDGTWSALARLSLPTEDLATWEALVCHATPTRGTQSWSTQPLRLPAQPRGQACSKEDHRGPQSRSQALLLGTIRLLFFKLLLFDMLMTCVHLWAGGSADTPGTGPSRLSLV